MIYAKPRCTWRARHIAWCRKYGKFCDAPREYEYCPGYEPRGLRTLPFVKVSHNIRVLRNQIFSSQMYAEIPTEVRESIRRFWESFLRARGLLVPPFTDVPRAKAELQKAFSEIEYQKEYMNPQDYEKIKAHLQWAIDFLERGLVAKAISELEGLFLFLTGKMLQGSQLPLTEVFPESLRLKPLFDMQDSLIEHKFPHEKSAIIDWIISCLGDIYRNMTHGYPDFGYVMEKWERLTSYATKPPLSRLQKGDWEEIRNQLQDPSYKALRDQYLSNLQRLREVTVKMPMDPKRQAVMIESLDMIKALILWFESQDPYAPPRQQLDRLTDAIASYFPREFFESSRVQIPPRMDMLYRYAIHPTIAGKYNTTMSQTLELKSRHGSELRDLIAEAENQKREVGVMLCRTPTGDLHLSRACWGRRGTVTVADCHDGLSPQGSFHVHLSGTSSFSVPDLKLAIRKEELSCLGYSKGGQPYLKCILPKQYYKYPLSERAHMNEMLSQAESYIERANRIFQNSPQSPEARAFSEKALNFLSEVERKLDVSEVSL